MGHDKADYFTTQEAHAVLDRYVSERLAGAAAAPSRSAAAAAPPAAAAPLRACGVVRRLPRPRWLRLPAHSYR